MNNVTTRYFCRKYRACVVGAKFALRFESMHDCYAALLNGKAGDHSAEWAIWATTRKGVMTDRDLRLFTIRCARRVQHRMTDQHSIDALDVAERYANGEATEEELNAALDAAWYAEYAEWYSSWNARAAAYATWAAVAASLDDSYVGVDGERNERKAQLEILKEFGNPF